MAEKHEIEPPWVRQPDEPPGSFVWREADQPWFEHVWKPYWDSLSAQARDAYLERWNVPDVWRRFYFDDGFRRWLDTVDDE